MTGEGGEMGWRQQSDKAYVILKLETLTKLLHKTRPTAFRNTRVTKVRATTRHVTFRAALYSYVSKGYSVKESWVRKLFLQ